MDRTAFAEWGDGLPDPEFSCAVAGLIFLAGAHSGEVRRSLLQGNLGATSPDHVRSVLNEKFRLPKDVFSTVRIDLNSFWQAQLRRAIDISPTPAYCSMIWKIVSEERNEIRFSFESFVLVEDMRFFGSVIEILTHEVTNITSVYFERTSQVYDGQIEWRLPVTFNALGDRLLERHFGGYQADRPNRSKHYPFSLNAISRRNAVSNVLIHVGNLAAAIRDITNTPYPLRSSFVIIFDCGDSNSYTSYLLTEAIMIETKSAGIALLKSKPSAEKVRNIIERIGDDLSHDTPLDVSLFRAFDEAPILKIYPELLEKTHLQERVTEISNTLMEMGETRLQLSHGATSRLFDTASEFTEFTAAEVAENVRAGRSRYEYHLESAEAQALSELESAIRNARRQQSAEEPRYIQREKTPEGSHSYSTMIAGKRHREEIRIGPSEEGYQDVESQFPEADLPPNQSGHKLQIVMVEPHHIPEGIHTELFLPQTGASSTAIFNFTPEKPGPFEARVSVLYRGRILQTALLTGQVMDPNAEAISEIPIKIETEMQIRPNLAALGSRSIFDLALIENDNHDKINRITAVAADHTTIKHVQIFEDSLTQLNELLTRIAFDIAAHDVSLTSPENTELLRELAMWGAVFKQDMVEEYLIPRGGQFGEKLELLESIQIISTKPKMAIPIEFVYDYSFPTKEAKLCRSYKKALREGKCPSKCNGQTNEGAYICPMGFWALKKIIERHTFDPTLDIPGDSNLAIQSEPIGERSTIPISKGALIAHSKRVRQDETIELEQLLRDFTNQNTKRAGNWTEWLDVINDVNPTLVVSFPHHDGQDPSYQLEIGNDSFLTRRLTSKHVRSNDQDPAPLVALFGCDTSGTMGKFANHVPLFRKNGAGIVVGTISTISTKHAPRMGKILVDQIISLSSENDVSFGEILRSAKRQAMLQSMPMALSVIAFGDADWLLTQKA